MVPEHEEDLVQRLRVGFCPARSDQATKTRIYRKATAPRRSRSISLRLGIVGALAAAALIVVSLNVLGTNGPLTVDQALAAITPAKGEVVHIKISGIDPNGRTFVQENWSTSETPWKYRGIAEASGQAVQEVALEGSGLHQIYDAKTNSILEFQDETVAGLHEPKVPGESYQKMIEDLLTSGRAQEDGHEEIDGRDAVRIVEKSPAPEGQTSENVYLVDAKTGVPIEWRVVNEDGNFTLHFDIYEKLPGTPENLELLDLKAAHPGATVYTDPAAFEQALGK